MKLTEHAVSAAPLLTAIAAGGDLSNPALAAASGRQANNMARDLTNLAKAGLILREPGSAPALTEEGREILAEVARAEGGHAAVELPLHLIDENPENPRQSECDEADAELTASIGRDGVLQPIMVRPSMQPGRYLVVMGSRRRRCALAAGKPTIPCVVRDLDAAKAFEVATIENLQRQDMNPLDEARAFKRILDDRLAADETLKLKDAKEVIAQATGKTVRFVELRLQLLTLSPTLQVEIALGVTTPKDAILRQRQTPKLNPKITPRQWLTLVEVLDAGLSLSEDEWDTDTPCRADAEAAIEADDELRALTEYPTYMLGSPQPLWADGSPTGRYEISVHSSSRTQLRLLATDRTGDEDPDLADPELRIRVLNALRDEVMGDEATAWTRGTDYLTPWLNGPFDPPPELLAEIAVKREERLAREDEQNAANAARLDAAAERRRRADRDNGAEGHALLSVVDQLEADAPNLSLGAFNSRFAAALASYDIAGPYSLDDHEDATGRIVDGAGVPTEASGPAMEARRRLICIAMNFAAGLPATSGDRYATPWRDAEGQITAPEAPTLELADPDDDETDDEEEVAFLDDDEDETVTATRQ